MEHQANNNYLPIYSRLDFIYHFTPLNCGHNLSALGAKTHQQLRRSRVFILLFAHAHKAARFVKTNAGRILGIDGQFQPCSAAFGIFQ